MPPTWIRGITILALLAVGACDFVDTMAPDAERMRPAAAVVGAEGFEMTLLGTLGDFGSSAFGVNSHGHVVGTSLISNQASRAFLWTPESGMVALPTLGGEVLNQARAINDDGYIAGVSGLPSVDGRFTWHAVRWGPDGAVEDLGTLGGCCSHAHAISRLGHVTGIATDATGRQRVFVWTPETGMQPVSLPSDTRGANAWGINDAGQIAGYRATWSPATGHLQHAFLWSPSSGVLDLPATGLSLNSAQDVNNSGIVVGFSQEFNIAGATGWTWSAAAGLNVLPSPGDDVHFVRPMAVNDNGDVTGQALFAGTPSPHAFHWTATAGMLRVSDASVSRSEGHDMNEAGQIAGVMSRSHDWRSYAVLWTPIRSPEALLQQLGGALQSLQESGALSAGEAASLRATLDAAMESLGRDRRNACVNQLGAFLNQVEALVRSRRLHADEAQSLIDVVRQAITLIEGG